MISLLNLRQNLVRRTSDFLGILSDCLVEPVATPFLTEVTLPCAFLLSARVPFVSLDNENPYSAEFSREIRQASYLSPQSRSSEKCYRLASQSRPAGCETASRPFEPSSIR